MAALPGQPLLGVIGGPDVVRGQGVHGPGVVDRPVLGHFGPRTDPDAVGLSDATVAQKRVRGRLTLGPHALFEGAPELRLVRGANAVVALVIECRVEEEAVVLELEVLLGLSNAALAQREELFALSERADGNRPFLERNRHIQEGTTQITETIPPVTAVDPRS